MHDRSEFTRDACQGVTLCIDSRLSTFSRSNFPWDHRIATLFDSFTPKRMNFELNDNIYNDYLTKKWIITHICIKIKENEDFFFSSFLSKFLEERKKHFNYFNQRE